MGVLSTMPIFSTFTRIPRSTRSLTSDASVAVRANRSSFAHNELIIWLQRSHARVELRPMHLRSGVRIEVDILLGNTGSHELLLLFREAGAGPVGPPTHAPITHSLHSSSSFSSSEPDCWGPHNPTRTLQDSVLSCWETASAEYNLITNYISNFAECVSPDSRPHQCSRKKTLVSPL